MKVLRWIVFLPYAMVAIAIAQTITGVVAESLSWWFSIPLVLFFNVGIFAAVYHPCGVVCPMPKVGSTIVVTLFLLLEPMAFIGSLDEMAWPEVVIRLNVDILIVVSAIGVAIIAGQDETEELLV
jgi:hypothetical protein